MEKSVSEQEREIKDLVRRGVRWSDKTGSLRKDCLRRLIDLAHSPHSSLKCFAAGSIQFFFKDFPELEEAAINAVYDLCEDQDPQVRMYGYAAITAVSKEQKKWVKRNADVLVQLLQSDEPDEVRYVKKALIEHLDLDPRATLGVLCDQITPPDPSLDEEEREVRTRLSRLVLSFITKDAKRAIVERHAHAQAGAVENILVDGLTGALPNLSDEEVELIISEILLFLPCYKPPPRSNEASSRGLSQNPEDYSNHGVFLVKGLFDRVKLVLKFNSPPPPPSATIPIHPFNRGFKLLEFVRTLVLKEHIAPLQQLLEFYLDVFNDLEMTQKIPSDKLGALVTQYGETITMWEDLVQNPTLRTPMVQKTMAVVPLVLKLLANSQITPTHSWMACRFLLKTWKECLAQHPKADWANPPNLVDPLRQIQSMPKPTNPGDAEVYLEVQGLVKALLAPPRAPQLAPPKIPIHRPVVDSPANKSPLARPNGLPVKPTTSEDPLPIKRRLNGQVEYSIRGASDDKGKSHSSPPAYDSSAAQRPSKRRKGGGDSEEDRPTGGGGVSLLSRLGGSMDEPTYHSSRRSTSQKDEDRGPPGLGLSIRGAASKAVGRSGSSSSLLERIGGDPGGRKGSRR